MMISPRQLSMRKIGWKNILFQFTFKNWEHSWDNCPSEHRTLSILITMTFNFLFNFDYLQKFMDPKLLGASGSKNMKFFGSLQWSWRHRFWLNVGYIFCCRQNSQTYYISNIRHQHQVAFHEYLIDVDIFKIFLFWVLLLTKLVNVDWWLQITLQWFLLQLTKTNLKLNY